MKKQCEATYCLLDLKDSYINSKFARSRTALILGVTILETEQNDSEECHSFLSTSMRMLGHSYLCLKDRDSALKWAERANQV